LAQLAVLDELHLLNFRKKYFVGVAPKTAEGVSWLVAIA
jgi:hypothetical protein